MTSGSRNNLGNPEQQLQNEYFFWLYQKIERRQDNGSRELASLLHSVVFNPVVPNDDNRAQDGITLRERFCLEHGLPCDNQIPGPCTMLEMLIGLSCKADDNLTSDPGQYNIQRWFWEMVDNLGLETFNERRNMAILDTFNARRYSPNGQGGLFPLRKAPHDQRKVEIWYQFMSYIDERYPEE